jgi:hypothetical protein
MYALLFVALERGHTVWCRAALQLFKAIGSHMDGASPQYKTALTPQRTTSRLVSQTTSSARCGAALQGGLTHRMTWYSHLYGECRCGIAPHRKQHRVTSLLWAKILILSIYNPHLIIIG